MNTMESMINERIRLGEAYIRGMLCESSLFNNKPELVRIIKKLDNEKYWADSPDNRKLIEVNKILKKMRSGNVVRNYIGKTPNKVPYIYMFNITKENDGKINGTIECIFEEEVEGFENPRLMVRTTMPDTHLNDMPLYVIIEPHALDRYGERNLKIGERKALSAEQKIMLINELKQGTTHVELNGINAYTPEGVLQGDSYMINGKYVTVYNTYKTRRMMFPTEVYDRNKSVDRVDKMMRGEYREIGNSDKLFKRLKDEEKINLYMNSFLETENPVLKKYKGASVGRCESI